MRTASKNRGNLQAICAFQRIGNRTRAGMQEVQTEMTTVKAAFLSFAMLSAIVLGGLGIYAADAASNHNAVDGYGVTASLR
jgi:hypothetical protein